MRRIFLLFAIFVIYMQTIQSIGNVHDCIHASRKLGKNGDGTIPSSCMNCDPALPECYFSCQELIGKMYIACDSVCLPDGYFFDPMSTMLGCWKDILPTLKIKIERCGCNSSSKLTTSLSFVFLSIIIGMLFSYII